MDIGTAIKFVGRAQMTHQELVAEIRAAASSLVTAAAATEHGDLAAAEIGVEDALFRVESLLGRLRQAMSNPDAAPSSIVTSGGRDERLS